MTWLLTTWKSGIGSGLQISQYSAFFRSLIKKLNECVTSFSPWEMWLLTSLDPEKCSLSLVFWFILFKLWKKFFFPPVLWQLFSLIITSILKICTMYVCWISFIHIPIDTLKEHQKTNESGFPWKKIHAGFPQRLFIYMLVARYLKTNDSMEVKWIWTPKCINHR